MVYGCIEEFVNIECLITDKTNIPMHEVINYLSRLEQVKKDLDCYIGSLMNDDEYIFELVLPLGTMSYCKVSDNEVIKLPFGSFSMNLWEKLLADKNNPVFMLLRYFEASIEELRKLLNFDSYEVITLGKLNEKGIIDIYSLHSYVCIYKDIDKYIV